MAARLLRAIPPLALGLALACSGPPRPPHSASNSQRLPFDHPTSPSGSSNQPLIPSPMGLPEGTFLTVRLSKTLSSETAHAGDGFQGVIDDPVVVDQQTVLASGAVVNGRVLDAKASAGPHNPGYLRITLVSLNVGGKIILIDTSSNLTKATPRSDRPSATGLAVSVSNDVVFSPDRRLTFRLAQAIDLQ